MTALIRSVIITLALYVFAPFMAAQAPISGPIVGGGGGGGSSTITTTTQSGTTYTLLAADCGTRILFTNAAAVTLTVPAGLGATCAVEIVQQTAAGFVTPTASSTTIHQELLLTKTARQYARAFLYATAADVFNLDGSLQ